MAIGIIVALTITGLVLFYAVEGRPWLKSKPWAAGFFALVEPFERVLFNKSETILFARLKMFTGLLLTLLTSLGTIDLSPIMPLVPDKYAGVLRIAFNLLPLSLTLVGWADQTLRNGTTLPIEIVSMPDKDITPKVAEAIAIAAATKAEAVAVVVEAKKT